MTYMIIKRELYLEKIRNYYESDLIKVITGIRRAGKSMILEQIISELRQSGIQKEQIIYVNFEDLDFEYINDAHKLNDFAKSRIINNQKYYLLFDEIQHVKEFEKAIASLKATKNVSIFVTGSNSRLLSGELATLLVGRTVEFKILPFNFKEACEYLRLKGVKVKDDFIFDYIKWGGFPQRFDLKNESEVKNYLESTYNGIITKDILTRNSDIETHKFKTISSYVLANAGKEFSSINIVNYFNAVNNKNKMEIDKKTIYNYLDKMEKAYFVSRVKRFNISGKEVLKTIEKQYAIDTGLRTINTNSVNYEDTFFLENIVYNELIVRGFDVYTGKTYNGEVDFVAIKDLKKCFIQVSYYMINEKTIEREFSAFSPIKDASPKIVLSLDRIDLSRNGIIHINIIDFLLGRVELPMT
ncbi:putative ATPase, AAA+ superfamily [Haploplasma axanthum]|uniref:Putative ATPase, AAA+ superfamily n=2 Tax=Haploplasma axanthum TaxID=29552 RepID=A0A449BF84_HAPAX|nr:putative ATPase, AAA+ superfamily [Haploplasma axanthum]